jgi:hypothetical protein
LWTFNQVTSSSWSSGLASRISSPIHNRLPTSDPTNASSSPFLRTVLKDSWK